MDNDIELTRGERKVLFVPYHRTASFPLQAPFKSVRLGICG